MQVFLVYTKKRKKEKTPHLWRRLVANPRRERRVLRLGLKGRRAGSTGGQSRAAPAWLLGSVGLGPVTPWSLHTGLSQRRSWEHTGLSQQER